MAGERCRTSYFCLYLDMEGKISLSGRVLPVKSFGYLCGISAVRCEYQEWHYFSELSRQRSQGTYASVIKLSRRYNRLYTLTAQTKETDFGGTKDTLQQVLGSFKPPTPVI